jgi:hypothetical protein
MKNSSIYDWKILVDYTDTLGNRFDGKLEPQVDIG